MKKTKLITLILLIFTILLLGAGCGATPTGSYPDGIFEGSSDAGMHEGLKVSVEVKDGKIAGITVIEHAETEGIGTKAIEKLPNLIIEEQSTEVDSVSGATLTSTAVKEAVENALSQETE